MMAKSGIDDLVRAIRAQGVTDPRVLEAFRVVRRADFVPHDLAGFAYEDRPLPIAHFQVTTQPSLIAQMVEALDLDPADCALEIGAGLGFQAAILSRLCDQVVTIERFPDLADAAQENLRRAGSCGWRPSSPHPSSGWSASTGARAIEDCGLKIADCGLRRVDEW